MNHLQVFLNTRIKNLGFCSDVGNLFLAPARFIFSGKTVTIERDQRTHLPKENGKFAKVSSFCVYSGDPRGKVSKQDRHLESTRWGYAVDAVLLPLIQLALLVPCTIVGSIFKAYSFFSPATREAVREAHRAVKEKLTAIDKTLGSKDVPVPKNTTHHKPLEEELRAYLKTGQKTNALIIYAEEKSLSAACLRIIKDINPLKVILVGKWQKKEFDVNQVIKSRQNSYKWKNWDISALIPSRQHFGTDKEKQDYFIPKPTVVNSVDAARNASRASFFSPKHVVYMVNDEDENFQNGISSSV